MSAKAKEGVERIHCNQCGRETKHDLLAKRRQESFIVPYPDDPITVDFVVTYSLLECRGCEEVTLRHVVWCSEDDPESPRAPIFYPPRVSRASPAWMDRTTVPSEYMGLLHEIYVALHADSRRLAAMGARALIDLIIQRRVGDHGSFGEGLTALVANGFLSTHHRDTVAAAIESGNASAHRGHRPSVVDIATVIDIVENLIQNELLADAASALRATTPPRPPRNNKKKNAKK